MNFERGKDALSLPLFTSPEKIFTTTSKTDLFLKKLFKFVS